MRQILIIDNYIPISSNPYYAGMHWAKRKKISDQWHIIVHSAIVEQQIMPIKEPVSITFQWHTKYDLDNNALMRKMIIDSIVLSKILISDTKKHIQKLTETINNDNESIIVIIEDIGEI